MLSKISIIIIKRGEYYCHHRQEPFEIGDIVYFRKEANGKKFYSIDPNIDVYDFRVRALEDSEVIQCSVPELIAPSYDVKRMGNEFYETKTTYKKIVQKYFYGDIVSYKNVEYIIIEFNGYEYKAVTQDKNSFKIEVFPHNFSEAG